MRIISSFHDYYDGVQAQGQDQSLIYLRKRNVVDLKKTNYLFPRMGAIYSSSKLKVHTWIVGFCGKIYTVLNVGKRRWDEDDELLCYSLDEVDTFVKTHFNNKEVDGYNKKSKITNRKWTGEYTRRNFERFFTKCKQQQTQYVHVFPLGCPIFVASITMRDSTITYNDSLKKLEFFRIFDTYSAFQEISMYLGSQAKPNKSIPKVSDKDMVMAKGFDKYSFRKDKIG